MSDRFRKSDRLDDRRIKIVTDWIKLVTDVSSVTDCMSDRLKTVTDWVSDRLN